MPLSLAKASFSVLLMFSPKGCFNTQKCSSRPPSRELFFVLAALGARHVFCCCNTSRTRIPILHMLFANVLLASRFFTSGVYWERIKNACANSNKKHYIILILFTRARFCNAMSLPPRPQQWFLFTHGVFDAAKIRFSHWRCRRTQFCYSRPRCRSHFFVAPALVAVHNFAFVNPSNGILSVLFGITLCVTFGELDFRTRETRRVYFARGVHKTIADLLKFQNQWNSLHL